MTMSYDDWMAKANPWAVVEAAATDSTARDAAVSRIINTMLEMQLVRRHNSVGYQPFSVTGNIPMPGCGRAVDQAMLAAERYHPDSQWHRACAWLMDRLPSRQAAAMMMQAARIRPDKMGDSQWMVTASQMVERQAFLLRSLGMAEYAVRPFESVEGMQKAARRARNTLRKWLEEEALAEAA